MVFKGSALSKNAPNKRFWTVFCTLALINKSVNQQTIQLNVLRHDLKLTTGFEVFLAAQGLIFSKKKTNKQKNWSKIAYLMEYIYHKCGSQKDVDKAVDSLN